MTIDEALQELTRLISPLSEAERIPVEDGLGRIIAADTHSPVPVPAFANSAMDGYAIRSDDLQANATNRLPIQGQSLAGHPFTDALEPRKAIRIFTGAALPEGADTVVIQEDTELDEHSSTPCVIIKELPKHGAYTRPVGHDVPQGARLLAKGARIRAFELASATTSGLSSLDVIRRLRIGVFATGDELRSPGDDLGPGEIYESNRIAIISLLTGLPLEINNLGILPDDPAATKAALANASSTHDALITSGGVSVGDADFVREAISELGGIDFWRLNLRPGKPFAFGHLNSQDSHRCLIFGLPGNPVSTIVTLLLLVKPALLHMAGASAEDQPMLPVPLAQDVSHSIGRHEFQRGTLVANESGAAVKTTSDQSSNRLQSFAGANCLFLLPGDRAHFKAGEMVRVLPLS